MFTPNPDLRGLTPAYLKHLESKEATTAEPDGKPSLYVKSSKADTQPVAQISQSIELKRRDTFNVVVLTPTKRKRVL